MEYPPMPKPIPADIELCFLALMPARRAVMEMQVEIPFISIIPLLAGIRNEVKGNKCVNV